MNTNLPFALSHDKHTLDARMHSVLLEISDNSNTHASQSILRKKINKIASTCYCLRHHHAHMSFRRSGRLSASNPLCQSCECWAERVCLSVGVSPMMQLTGKPCLLCPLHAGIDLTHWDSMMAYNISGVAHNVRAVVGYFLRNQYFANVLEF